MSKHPGYDWLITPTHDWKQDEDGNPPAGPYAWFRYQADGTRSKGYAHSKAEAQAQATA